MYGGSFMKMKLFVFKKTSVFYFILFNLIQYISSFTSFILLNNSNNVGFKEVTLNTISSSDVNIKLS